MGTSIEIEPDAVRVRPRRLGNGPERLCRTTMPFFPKRILNPLILLAFFASLGSAIPRRSTLHLRTVNAAPQPRGAHSRPSFAHRDTLQTEGRREGRVQAAPMARLQKEKQAAVTTGLAEQPAFPARWLNGCSVLSQGTGLACPRHRDVADQDTSVGVSGPHGLTVRPGFVRPHAKRALRPQAATASPAPRSVTIAKRPF